MKHLFLFVVLSLQLAAACTSSRRPDTQNDGQTHWMRVCSTSAQCEALECLCGVCALPCEAADACQSALGPTATCFDVEALYYGDGLLPDGPRTIRRVPKDGSGEPSAFVEERLPFAFVVAPGHLYFSERGKRDELGNHDGSGRIMRAPLDGSALEAVAEPAGEPMALAVDGSGVYWIEVDAANRKTELWRAPREGGPAQRLLTSDLRPLHTIRLTANKVYWKAFCESDGASNIPGDTYILGIAKP